MSELQVKLIPLIEQFYDALNFSQHDKTESEALCRAICCWMDKRISINLDKKQLSWKRYYLENYFYGFSKEDIPLTEQLTRLIQTRDETIFLYAYKILALSAEYIGKDENVVKLLAENSFRLKKLPKNTIKPPELIVKVAAPRRSRFRINWRLFIFLEVCILMILIFLTWQHCSSYVDNL